MDQVLQQFRDRITSATRSGTALRIRGNGTKDWYGQELAGELLDTTAYSGIVSYDPTELVITARAGTNLREIGKALAEKKQMLAFEPPRFDGLATVGGIVASGLSGPRRQAVGSVRDFVLGTVLMDGKGEVLHFGGQVMKNVAGYDVSRLLTGSLGTLGLILEVSLKVLPRPFAQHSLQFAMSEQDALHQLNLWGGQPLPLSASCWLDGKLYVRLSGAQAAVDAAMAKMGGADLPDAEKFWDEVREQTHSFFSTPQQGLWRLSLPTVAPPLALPGEQMIEWGGALRWLKTTAEATAVRSVAANAGGHATLYKGGDKSVGVFQPLAPSVARIHRNLKNAFDPVGIFNPRRMYSDF
ncbi:MAG: glycolate oxidase subunit GlcE [Betaproteobacteria bacterium]|nr:glycolate oxidase subunit GlcE [Betaproteobacteria bacterium]